MRPCPRPAVSVGTDGRRTLGVFAMGERAHSVDRGGAPGRKLALALRAAQRVGRPNRPACLTTGPLPWSSALFYWVQCLGSTSALPRLLPAAGLSVSVQENKYRQQGQQRAAGEPSRDPQLPNPPVKERQCQAGETTAKGGHGKTVSQHLFGDSSPTSETARMKGQPGVQRIPSAYHIDFWDSNRWQIKTPTVGNGTFSGRRLGH